MSTYFVALLFFSMQVLADIGKVTLTESPLLMAEQGELPLECEDMLAPGLIGHDSIVAFWNEVLQAIAGSKKLELHSNFFDPFGIHFSNQERRTALGQSEQLLSEVSDPKFLSQLNRRLYVLSKGKFQLYPVLANRAMEFGFGRISHNNYLSRPDLQTRYFIVLGKEGDWGISVTGTAGAAMIWEKLNLPQSEN